MAGAIAPLQRIVVAANPQVPEAAQVMVEITYFLTARGISTFSALLDDEEMRQRVRKQEFDLFIALGGDGTMLRAGTLCGPHHLPILGINLGRIGFLTEVAQDQWREALPLLFQGKGKSKSRPYWLEPRMMLRSEQWRGGQMLGCWDVLNEIAVGRGHTVRPVELTTHVDRRFLTNYVADALIAATPTGSTAYALAAGGPILPPELRNILLVPVAPHLSLERAIVLHEGSSVSITVHTSHEAVLSADGQAPIPLEDGDRIDAFASEHSVQFVRFQDPGYFYRNLTQHMSQNPSSGNHR